MVRVNGAPIAVLTALLIERGLVKSHEEQLPPQGTKRARYSGHSDRPSVSSGSAQSPAENSPGSISDHHAKITRSASQLGPNWFFNKIPIPSEAGCRWMAARTGQDVSGNEFDIPGFTPPPSSILSSGLQNGFELPDQDLLREMLNKFFRSSFGREFPVLDKDSLEKTIETAYTPVDENDISSVQLSARACILGAFSFISTQKEFREMLDRDGISIDFERCTSEAQRLFFYIQGDSSLETLQTALFLVLQQIFQGLWQDAALYHSIACRIVCSLKGHIHHSIPHVFPENLDAEGKKTRHTRVLFWLCYMLDKDIALRTGNPPYLTDASCDLDPVDFSALYSKYPVESSDYPSTGEVIFGGDIQFLPEDPYLSRLKETVFLQLFSAGAMNQSDGQILAHIRELDDDIERWRLSIPPNFRPNLSIPPNELPDIKIPELTSFTRRMSLRLNYHHLVTVIHTTVRRCSVEFSEELHHVVHSSFDLALEASRSTIWCLSTLIKNIAEEAFR
ncbi:uncharacterized protein N7483_000258 [Penicillium malachiteum]|uniref:uncharacterized protein n=1 Tax=Penicillium malachiteum TaxID=1324776 RepID=UPI0025478CBA|nr:uncharacterized protein N7483_000258 [Penicillium malachiteum]KAJ5735133.1 hypothetical protein N7483_000258 [Penicillium malachiteum]